MAILIRTIGRFFALFPGRGIWFNSWFLYLLAYFMFGYRKRVVKENLLMAFPEKSEDELKNIEKKFYFRFCKTLAELLITPYISEKYLYEKAVLKESERGDYLEGTQSQRGGIMLTGHFFNWEWAGLRVGMVSKKPFYVVYLPLKSQSFDAYFRDLRGKFGNIPVKMRHIFRALTENHDQKPVACFLADQSPPRGRAVNYHDFFGRRVPFYNGAVKMAKKLDLPLLFGYPEYKNDGTYTVKIEVLAQYPAQFNDEELLELYVRKLEETIRFDPANWLWSHRRWKHAKKEGEI